MELIDRYFMSPEGSFFLFGPRGTGKSTYVKNQFPRAYYIDLLDPENVRSFSAKPERLEEVVQAKTNEKTFIIGEIQRVPELLTVVHRLIEAKQGYRFILTGSSARKLKRSGVDLLAGRALVTTMHPFMASELGGQFRLDDAVVNGLLPLVYGSETPTETLRSYAALYVREEVQMEGLVRNIGNFSRFLEAVSFSHASVLNITNIARECEVERKMVEAYIAILEDNLLDFRLPVFTRRAKRALSSHPKFYLFDSGVFTALRLRGPLDRAEEIQGQALEGLVAQHLRAWSAYSGDNSELGFWRTRAGLEVDFVVYNSREMWGLEVKNGARVIPSDLRGLKAFQKEYPEAHVTLLYRGKDRLVRDDILCLPCPDFLSKLYPGESIQKACQ